VVVHAGSGRELGKVMTFCERTQATLLELATGSAVETLEPSFPVVLCPNTNILMLKFMSMIAVSGSLFRGYEILFEESHQSRKTSVPGTAYAIAQSLDLPTESIQSERDPQRQMNEFAVPAEHLDRHAVHRISISDGGCTLRLEARVLDATPYARGVGHLLEALRSRRLAPGLHRVEQLVRDGWL
jgi:dihydrodipicolinate reductase